MKKSKHSASRALGLLLLVCLTLVSTHVFAQSVTTIRGQVVDKRTGDPMTGATVQELSTANGTVVDADGAFTLRVRQGATLVVSSIGYKSQQATAKDGMRVALEEESEMMDEVVVVGYGVQKKVNLTGAVASVGSEKLENRPITSLSQGLAGLAAGVQVRQSSGQPGSDGASISIRGTGTFGGGSTSPLIVIDGIVCDEGNAINSVNPEDVENISVLKDAASAAIYGSRGANGVVLITTKQGKKGTPTITYSALFAQQQVSNKFQIESNTAEWMEMHNRVVMNDDPHGVAADPTKLRFFLDDIEAWRHATANPNDTDNEWGKPNWLAYPNTDWTDYFYKSKFYTKHTIQAQGGGENSSYLLSASYQKNPGTMPNTGIDEYGFRVNLETRVAHFLRVGTKSYVNHRYGQVGDPSTGGALYYINQMVPAMTPEHDGRYGALERRSDGREINTTMTSQNMENALARCVNRDGQNITTRINTTWYAGADLFDNALRLEAKYNYQDTQWDKRSWDVNVKRYSFRTDEVMSEYNGDLSVATTSRSYTRQIQKNFVATANFAKTFGPHDVAALVGYETTYWNYSGFSASKKGLIDYSIHDITTGIDMNSIGGSNERDYAMKSFFGRANYSYKSRYMVEANLRRDGSSRFAPGHKWGVFPSFSAGWRISEEKFFQPLRGVVDGLKLRASWGKTGNVTSGYYSWQGLYNTASLVLGESVSKGIYQSQLPNYDLTWERVATTDIGLDAQLFGQRLGVEIDYYNRHTKGVLVPSIYNYETRGDVGLPSMNDAEVTNRGLELSLNWHDHIGDVKYSVGLNFSTNKNEVTKYKGQLEYAYDPSTPDVNGNPTYKYMNLNTVYSSGALEGHPLGEAFLQTVYHGSGSYFTADGTVDPMGGPRDGMIRTSQDLDWVRQMVAAGYKFNNQSTAAVDRNRIWYGETIYADNNGDGNYGNEYDRKWTGKSSTPRYNFGVSLSASWKGIDVSMLWSGQGGMYYTLYGNGLNNPAIANASNTIPTGARDNFYWFDEANYDSPELDPNSNYATAPYARLTSGAHTHQGNTAEQHSATYLKLKNLQVGYTLPRKWTEKFYCSNMRIFFSGENIVCISSFPGQDPELGGIGFGAYPLPRTLSAGLNLTF